MATTTYALAARHKKVAAIIAKAAELKITSRDMQDAVDKNDEGAWLDLAARAGVNRPSDESKALIISRMRALEAKQ